MKFQLIFKKINPFLALIIILAFFLRFVDYPDRWALAYDQAWFAINARHAINTFQLPLLGPFASGGPFQTGGEWFWIVMLGTLWAPNLVIAPWIFITFLSIFQVYLMYLLGKEILNKKFGLILALLIAVSPSQTLQATNLTNQTTISLWSILLLFSILLYQKKGSLKFLFLAGLSIGLASSQHLQGVLLLPVIIVFILVEKIFSFKKLSLISLGILVPWTPVLIVDLQNGLYNTKSMLTYFSSDQSKTSYEVLGRRWLTFILEYIPKSWSRIIGGISITGYIEIILLAALAIKEFVTGKITRFWYIVGISVFIITILLRYIRTPLFENYITFLHPFILILVGWLIYKIIKWHKFLGIIFIITISIISIYESANEFKNSTNLSYPESKRIAEMLIINYPNSKFSLYDFNDITVGKTLSLVLYLETIGKIDDNGTKIGLSVKDEETTGALKHYPVVHGEDGDIQIFDLSASSSSELKKTNWKNKSPKVVYDSVQNWFRIEE